MFRFSQITACVAILLLSGTLVAQDSGEKVDIFEGISKGQIDVRLIPKNEKSSQLLITNKTDKPLSVTMPPAFAGVPVLSQFGGGMMMGGGAAPQAIGGGPGGGGNNAFPMFNVGNQGQNGFFNFNQPGFAFNIAPEKVGRLKLTTVCLEHGRKTPNPRVEYELKPIQEVATQPGTAEICALLAAGKVSQRVAQLAAWNLQNDKSWSELAKKSSQGAFVRKPLYSQQEIQAAQRLAKKVVEMAKKSPRDNSYSSN